MKDEILNISMQLCQPDPTRRGDPRVRASKYVRNYDLQPYVSRFNRLAKIAEVKMI